MCYFENLNVLFRKPGCAAAAASSSLGVASDLPLCWTEDKSKSPRPSHYNTWVLGAEWLEGVV